MKKFFIELAHEGKEFTCSLSEKSELAINIYVKIDKIEDYNKHRVYCSYAYFKTILITPEDNKEILGIVYETVVVIGDYKFSETYHTIEDALLLIRKKLNY